MTDAQVNPFRYRLPCNLDENTSFANAHAYEWAYRDYAPNRVPVPEGWPFAWLEYVRRNPSRMAIHDAFKVWQDTGILPGLD